MYLGIEIGGTKLQLGVGRGDGSELLALRRAKIVPADGAAGIREQIVALGGELTSQHDVEAVGIGFGGPVLAAEGRTIESHQIEGWEDFPLAAWCAEALGRPTRIANDCDAAGLAEAHFGAGAGHGCLFYVTVGSGVGGGLIIGGTIHGAASPAAAEIGQLRLGPDARDPSQTVESIASGWGIARQFQHALSDAGREPGSADVPQIAQKAREGDKTAKDVLAQAVRTLGWAIAQMMTLLAPSMVVVGGGVSLLGEELFLAPLRREIDSFVFPALRSTYEVRLAQLDELVVVHGALALAAR